MIIHLHPSENIEFLSTWKPTLSPLRANWIPLRSLRIYCLWWIPATCFILLQTDVETSPQPNFMLIIFNFTDCHWQIPAICFILFHPVSGCFMILHDTTKLHVNNLSFRSLTCPSVCSSGHRHSTRWGLQCERLSGVPELWGGGRANTCPHLEEGEFLCHHSDTQLIIKWGFF